MKFLFSPILILTVFLSSCSTYVVPPGPIVNREVANESLLPITADELFTIKSTTNIDPTSNQMVVFKISMSEMYGVNIEYIEDSKLDNSIAYKIVPVAENQVYKLKVYYSSMGKMDVDAGKELSSFFLNTIARNFAHPLSIFEIYYNAMAKDFQSLSTLVKIRTTLLQSPESLEYWKTIQERLFVFEKAHNKKTRELEQSRKIIMDKLDAAPEEEQFKNMVARNDRKGVAALIKKYLPWEQMGSFEKTFWENHLKIMADPLPIEERIFIYRGIDDDVINVAFNEGQKLSKEEAIKEQKIFFMSTMLTKNQGSWNRRLRSLTSMYDKFITANNTDQNFPISELTKAVRITTMLKNHADDPLGSPFLSFTPAYHIAEFFGKKRMAAYLIDPRAIHSNYTSKYLGEMEFLTPLIIFPDDVAAIYDKALYPDVSDVPVFLKEKTYEYLARKLGKNKSEAAGAYIVENSRNFFSISHAKTMYAIGLQPPIKAESITLAKEVASLTAKAAAKKLRETNGMNCIELLQLFWKQ